MVARVTIHVIGYNKYIGSVKLGRCRACTVYKMAELGSHLLVGVYKVYHHIIEIKHRGI